MADEIATFASKHFLNNIIDYISSNDIFTLIRYKTLLAWQHQWDSVSLTK
jgi:hypothetical protein